MATEGFYRCTVTGDGFTLQAATCPKRKHRKLQALSSRPSLRGSPTFPAIAPTAAPRCAIHAAKWCARPVASF